MATTERLAPTTNMEYTSIQQMVTKERLAQTSYMEYTNIQ